MKKDYVLTPWRKFLLFFLLSRGRTDRIYRVENDKEIYGKRNSCTSLFTFLRLGFVGVSNALLHGGSCCSSVCVLCRASMDKFLTKSPQWAITMKTNNKGRMHQLCIRVRSDAPEWIPTFHGGLIGPTKKDSRRVKFFPSVNNDKSPGRENGIVVVSACSLRISYTR